MNLGTQIQLMGHSAEILKMLKIDEKFAGIQVAFVSRTTEPDWANELIPMMPVHSVCFCFVFVFLFFGLFWFVVVFLGEGGALTLFLLSVSPFLLFLPPCFLLRSFV